MSSEKQFFIVVGEIQQCRWTSYEEQCEGNILPGCIVVIRPCNGGNEFEVHRRRSGGRPTPVLISREGGLPQDKVVVITDQEFDILLAIYDSLSRLNLHSSERLKWACRLKVGDKVQVEIDNSESRVAGVIRGSGTVRADRADYGLQFVVELMESSFKYLYGDKGRPGTKFLCTKNCCIIVSADLLYPPEQSKTLTTKAATNEKAESEAAAVEVKVKPSLSIAPLSRKISVKETIKQLDQQCEEMEKRIEELEDQVSNLTSDNTEKEQMMRGLNGQVQNLQVKLQEKVAQINQQEEKISTNEVKIEKLHNELKEKQEEIDTIKAESEQQLRDQQQQHEQAVTELWQRNERILRELQERHQQEENRLQQEQEQLQQ